MSETQPGPCAPLGPSVKAMHVRDQLLQQAEEILQAEQRSEVQKPASPPPSPPCSTSEPGPLSDETVDIDSAYDSDVPVTKSTLLSVALNSSSHNDGVPDTTPKDEAAPAPKPFEAINALLQFKSDDHQFWWMRTGRLFAQLLDGAGYTAAEQYRELFFYALHVAPQLGPAPDAEGRPRRWRSPGTPDATPIDFSWEWGRDGATGVVRYSFEPIGPRAGTPADPRNAHATEQWITVLGAQGLVPGLDLEWYRHFTRELLDYEETTPSSAGFIEETTPKAGSVVALDLEKAGPVMKIYLYPGLKAAALGVDNLDVVADAIRRLPAAQYAALRPHVEPLLAYLYEGTARWGFETGILSLDLLAPAAGPRLKLYVRAPHTTSAYLADALSMGGRRDLAAEGYGADALADLRDFWDAFVAGAPDVLPADAPGRASPGFYYTVGGGEGGGAATPKLYLAPFWYCGSDAEVMRRLRRYFANRRTGKDMGVQMGRYERALEAAFGTETLEARCGSHYYVGCALQKDELRVVTYLAPQTFACEREAILARRGEARAT